MATQARAGAADGKPLAPARYQPGGTDGEVQGLESGPARGTARQEAAQEGHGAQQAATPQRSGTDRAAASDAARELSAGQRVIAAAMTELQLEQHVWRLVEGLGLLGYHTHDSRRSQAGFPDWTIAGRTVIYRELKREKGRLTEAQRAWLTGLEQAGADVGVWRPSSLLSGEIAEQLTAISRRTAGVA